MSNKRTIKNFGLKGFTLIELLVVIAIIALLLAIIMPSLGKAKSQAMMIICRSNLRQWGLQNQLYVNDNDDSFISGYESWAISDEGLWTEALRGYYDIDDIRLCPKATKRWDQHPEVKYTDADGDRIFTSKSAWHINNSAYANVSGDYGSYAYNRWVANPPKRYESALNSSGFQWDKHWKKMGNVKTPYNVPLIGDGNWEGGHPRNSDAAPSKEGEVTSDNSNRIKNFCVNRHNKHAQVILLDGSVKKVTLKGLWDLKWSLIFNTGQEPSNAWPDWIDR